LPLSRRGHRSPCGLLFSQAKSSITGSAALRLLRRAAVVDGPVAIRGAEPLVRGVFAVARRQPRHPDLERGIDDKDGCRRVALSRERGSPARAERVRSCHPKGRWRFFHSKLSRYPTVPWTIRIVVATFYRTRAGSRVPRGVSAPGRSQRYECRSCRRSCS
jgi:hypothetical protein